MSITKKKLLENWANLSGDERERFVGNLPASREKIEDLFDYLDIHLAKSPCSHDLKNTMQFLMERQLSMPRVMSWLNENGAYCDCEILEKLEPQWFKAFADEDFDEPASDDDDQALARENP